MFQRNSSGPKSSQIKVIPVDSRSGEGKNWIYTYSEGYKIILPLKSSTSITFAFSEKVSDCQMITWDMKKRQNEDVYDIIGVVKEQKSRDAKDKVPFQV